MHQAWILTGLLPHLLAIPRLFASLQIAPLAQPKTFTANTATPNSSPGPNEWKLQSHEESPPLTLSKCFLELQTYRQICTLVGDPKWSLDPNSGCIAIPKWQEIWLIDHYSWEFPNAGMRSSTGVRSVPPDQKCTCSAYLCRRKVLSGPATLYMMLASKAPTLKRHPLHPYHNTLLELQKKAKQHTHPTHHKSTIRTQTLLFDSRFHSTWTSEITSNVYPIHLTHIEAPSF